MTKLNLFSCADRDTYTKNNNNNNSLPPPSKKKEDMHIYFVLKVFKNIFIFIDIYVYIYKHI